MQQMRKAERGLARRTGEHHAGRAEKLIFREEVVDQERQHEQRPQQRLVVALPPGESSIAADAGIGVVDGGCDLAMRRGIAQAPLADVGGLDDQMRRHREITEQPFAFGDVRML